MFHFKTLTLHCPERSFGDFSIGLWTKFFAVARDIWTPSPVDEMQSNGMTILCSLRVMVANQSGSMQGTLRPRQSFLVCRIADRFKAHAHS